MPIAGTGAVFNGSLQDAIVMLREFHARKQVLKDPLQWKKSKQLIWWQFGEEKLHARAEILLKLFRK